MGYTISLKGIKEKGSFGVTKLERQTPQTIKVDAKINIYSTPINDTINPQIDYSLFSKIISKCILEREFALIETLAEVIADSLFLQSPLIDSCRITVHKPNAAVGVYLEGCSVTITKQSTDPKSPFLNKPSEQVENIVEPSNKEEVPNTQETNKVVLALGSNKGDSLNILRGAIESIKQFVNIEKIGPLARTVAVLDNEDELLDEDKRDYFNSVITGTTTITPEQLLEETQKIEQEYGRNKFNSVKNSARTLDIDIIDFSNKTINSENLTIPHPRASKRSFVLLPWQVIEPNAQLSGTPISTLVSTTTDKDCIRYLALDWQSADVYKEGFSID